MKAYIKALAEYEIDNNCYYLLKNYLFSKNKNLIELYCKGVLNLPSYIIIKKIRKKYFNLINYDNELKTLFARAINYSKIFYYRTVKLIKNPKKNSGDIEKIFEKKLQPLGQFLINILIKIKLRVRYIRIKRQKFFLGRKYFINFFVSKFINTITYISIHPLITKTIIIALILTIDILINTNLRTANFTSYLSLFNIIYFLAGIVVVGVMSPAHKFYNPDVNGNNQIAYHYRLFFNNISNKRVQNIFAS